MSTEHVEVGRFYTLARRFPILVGKLDAGTKLPFGPYTLPQVVGTSLVLYVLARTWSWWTQLPPVAAVAIGVGLPVGMAIALRHLPVTGRGLFSAGMSVLDLLTGTTGGRVCRQTVTVRPPHRVRGRIIVCSSQPEAPLPASPPPASESVMDEAPPAPDPIEVVEAAEAAEADSVPVTGVSRLLAAAVRESSHDGRGPR